MAKSVLCAGRRRLDPAIEFHVTGERGPIPVEVKSGVRTKARSLGQYISRYKPELAIRLSAKPLAWDPDRRLLNLPLPLAHWIETWATRNVGDEYGPGVDLANKVDQTPNKEDIFGVCSKSPSPCHCHNPSSARPFCHGK